MAAEQARSRTRMSAEQRRKQLIGIGLRLLVDRPIHELSIDEVATKAGISRGLLFHYFPSKREYYAAVVRAAGNRILSYAQAPDEGTPHQRVRAIVEGFVGFVQRRRANYVALVRGSAGGDELVTEVFDGIRNTLTERVLVAINQPHATGLLRLAVRGWLAMAEEMAIESSAEDLNADELTTFLMDSLDRVLRAVPPAAGDQPYAIEQCSISG